MKTKLVEVPSVRVPIAKSSGFAKKELSNFKLDACGLCEFGCTYCSSNVGHYLRMRRRQFADLTEEQLGERSLPADDPFLMFVWPEFLDRLRSQLETVSPTWGAGKTLVYSMLTDGFSPHLVKTGVTEEALRLVLERTSFRIRVLTKNAIVGTPDWVAFFKEYSSRFVVGLSTGTQDDRWAKRVERRTPPPSRRLEALARLQDAGIPTYGMLCPVFPDVLDGDGLERFVDRICPDRVEHIWAEPYNDRHNWRKVREGYRPGSYGYRWLTDAYERSRKDLWSTYASELYLRLRKKACDEGWLHKLRYLLYESDITPEDAEQFRGLEGVLLQSKSASEGRSCHPSFAAMQQA